MLYNRCAGKMYCVGCRHIMLQQLNKTGFNFMIKYRALLHIFYTTTYISMNEKQQIGEALNQSGYADLYISIPSLKN